MSSNKRSASVGKAPPAKRHDWGQNKDNNGKSSLITPQLKPGAYRLVTKLKPCVVGDGVNHDHWPAVVCDDRMVKYLFCGKNEPKDAKEAFHNPGLFEDVKIPEKAKVSPVWLIGKKMPVYVPNNLLTVMDETAIKVALDDDATDQELREAYEAVLQQHDLEYWRIQMSGNATPNIGDEYDDDEGDSDAENARAADKMLSSGRQNQSEPAPSVSGAFAYADRAKSLDPFRASGGLAEAVDSDSAAILSFGQNEKIVDDPAAVRERKDVEMKDVGLIEVIGSSPENTHEPADAFMGGTDSFNANAKHNDQQPVARRGEIAKDEQKPNLRQLAMAARSDMAKRKANKDEIRVIVGHNNAEFIVPQSAIAESAYLTTKIDFDPEDGESKLASYKLSRLSADDFESVAEYLDTGDFKPFIMKSESEGLILKDFKDTPTNVQNLVVLCKDMCNIASQLELAKLRHQAVQKFRLLAPYRAADFVQFLTTMLAQDFCGDEALKAWVVDYAVMEYYNLHVEQAFGRLLRDNAGFAKMVHRVMVGLPAEEEDEATLRKRRGKKKAETANPPQVPDTPSQAPAKKQAAASVKATASLESQKSTTAKKSGTLAAKPAASKPVSAASKTASDATAAESSTTNPGKAASAKPADTKAPAAKRVTTTRKTKSNVSNTMDVIQFEHEGDDDDQGDESDIIEPKKNEMIKSVGKKAMAAMDTGPESKAVKSNGPKAGIKKAGAKTKPASSASSRAPTPIDTALPATTRLDDAPGMSTFLKKPLKAEESAGSRKTPAKQNAVDQLTEDAPTPALTPKTPASGQKSLVFVDTDDEILDSDE